MRSCTTARSTFLVVFILLYVTPRYGKQMSPNRLWRKIKYLKREKKFRLRQVVLPVFGFFSILSTLTTHIPKASKQKAQIFLTYVKSEGLVSQNFLGIALII